MGINIVNLIRRKSPLMKMTTDMCVFVRSRQKFKSQMYTSKEAIASYHTNICVKFLLAYIRFTLKSFDIYSCILLQLQQ